MKKLNIEVDTVTDNCKITDENGNVVEHVMKVEILPLTATSLVQARLTFCDVSLKINNAELVHDEKESNFLKVLPLFVGFIALVAGFIL